MSYMKRYLEDRIDELAKKYALPWNYVYDQAEYFEFDLEKTEAYIKKRYDI